MNKLACIAWSCALVFARAETVYFETFPEHRDPSRYTRIAQMAEKWEVQKDADGARFLRVTMQPETSRRKGLVVWDLAPIHFDSLQVEVRTDAASPVFLSLAVNDRFGNAYLFAPYGKSATAQRKPLPTGETWTRYIAKIPTDITRMYRQGKEIAPFLHGRGEAVSDWKNVDLTNLGMKILHFEVLVPPNSPLIGKEFTFDFRYLRLEVNR